MYTVGLTGGIASGKTTVSDLFTEMGAGVVDADVAARKVVEPGQSALAEIADVFGPDVLDERGELNRRALRERVFADEQARKKLEAILHPAIREYMAGWIARLESEGAPYCIRVVPLLVETGQQHDVDRVLVVDVPRETQVTRVVMRDGGSDAQADQILATQASREERLAVADDVIQNTGEIGELKAQVELLHQQYLTLSSG